MLQFVTRLQYSDLYYKCLTIVMIVGPVDRTNLGQATSVNYNRKVLGKLNCTFTIV